MVRVYGLLIGMGSVEMDVVNKNLFDRNKSSDNFYYNSSGEKQMDGTNRFINQELPLSSSYTISYKNAVNSTSLAYVRMIEYDKNNTFIKRTLLSNNNSTVNIDNKTNKVIACVDSGPNAYFEGLQIAKSSKISDIVEHKQQTAIMPIQQELLENDYVADVEHHEWEKVVLDGTEKWKEATTNNLKRFFYEVSVRGIDSLSTVNCISNYFKGTSRNKLESSSGDEISVSDKFLNILSKKIETKEDFKAGLKSKYDEGNPVIVYYKLATPVDLELTDEQKAVRNQKLYTYKNITNISVSDELASVDIDYKKDITLEHNKLQSQIDEIKQLLSTTETSALLLDNLQKNVESEVE